MRAASRASLLAFDDLFPTLYCPSMSIGRVAWQDAWRERFYASRPGWLDGTTEFWDLCRAAIAPRSRILEIGPGPGGPTSHFLATLGDLHGVDVDPAVTSNPDLCASAVMEDGRFPYPSSSFDVCVSNFVLEHVDNPDLHFQEVLRVLRPGGTYVIRTPNQWHYVALAARATPHWFHEMVSNRMRRLPPDAHEPYPTYYRANSLRALTRLANTTGFRVETLRTIEKEPSYGMSSRLLFLVFLGYERLVNSHHIFQGMRANILGVFVKSCRPSAL
jgi:SAM-dependent methyltransferase